MTKIQWTDKTWNPFTGCSKVSAACDNCYAEKMALRLKQIPATAEKYKNGFTPTFHYDELHTPSKWKKPQRIFVVSMGDIFHSNNSNLEIGSVFEVMLKENQHTYFILTKRPQNMKRFLKWFHSYNHTSYNDNDFTHIWFGVTAENQQMANKRLKILCSIPEVNKFVSIEPMLGPINIIKWLPKNDKQKQTHNLLSWVIVGGETGNNARPMHPLWVSSILKQCEKTLVPFFFKSWGKWTSFFSYKNNNTRVGIPRGYYSSFLDWSQNVNTSSKDILVDTNGKICENAYDMKSAIYPVIVLSPIRTLPKHIIRENNLIDGQTYIQKHNHSFNQ
jgi:protein gp37